LPREITPYLMFNGDCQAAMTFYQQVLGGTLDVRTYGQTNPATPAEDKDKVIHARLESGATVIMASDSGSGHPRVKDGDDVWLSLQCGPASEVDAIHAKLGAGGRSTQPPQDTFWGTRFAMLEDRFGVQWMLNSDPLPGSGRPQG
jgi:PhnB protein